MKKKEMNAKGTNSRRKKGVPISSRKKAGRASAQQAITGTVEKENREHKDSLFVSLFYEDESATENLLSLCNALHDTDYLNEDVIQKIRIEKILYMNFKNDISFIIGEKILVFGEHQSTVNANMPLRCLMYVGRAYEQLVDSNDRYKTTLIKIPAPEFFTFYNGTEKFPLEKELCLSDAFICPADGSTLDLKVKVININPSAGHKILDKCRVLKEYGLFIDTVRKYSGEDAPIERAVKECIAKGILADYLKRKGSEVVNMLTAEYSYEDDIRVKQQESMMIGEKRGKKKGIILSGKIFKTISENPHATNSQIAQGLNCSTEDVKNVREAFKI